jgi:hypothetical protein
MRFAEKNKTILFCQLFVSIFLLLAIKGPVDAKTKKWLEKYGAISATISTVGSFCELPKTTNEILVDKAFKDSSKIYFDFINSQTMTLPDDEYSIFKNTYDQWSKRSLGAIFSKKVGDNYTVNDVYCRERVEEARILLEALVENIHKSQKDKNELVNFGRYFNKVLELKTQYSEIFIEIAKLDQISLSLAKNEVSLDYALKKVEVLTSELTSRITSANKKLNEMMVPEIKNTFMSTGVKDFNYYLESLPTKLNEALTNSKDIFSAIYKGDLTVVKQLNIRAMESQIAFLEGDNAFISLQKYRIDKNHPTYSLLSIYSHGNSAMTLWLKSIVNDLRNDFPGSTLYLNSEDSKAYIRTALIEVESALKLIALSDQIIDVWGEKYRRKSSNDKQFIHMFDPMLTTFRQMFEVEIKITKTIQVAIEDYSEGKSEVTVLSLMMGLIKKRSELQKKLGTMVANLNN